MVASPLHRRIRLPRTLIVALFLLLLLGPLPALAQSRGGSAEPPPSIADKTAGMEKMDGFFPLYWDADAGTLYMEIPRLDEDVLYYSALAAGVGSNDIGLDRGQVGGEKLVRFHRVGPKVLMIQPNLEYRADSDNPDEVRAVEEAFAQSVIWGFTVAAQEDGRVLVDTTDFLLRDAHGVANRLQPAQYRLDTSRSAVYMDRTKSFPKNTEMEATLTFVTSGGGRGGFGGFGNQRGPGGGFGRGSLAAVTPDTSAVTVRQHHSFVELPPPGYEPRAYDPRSGAFNFSFQDYAVPLGTDMTRRFIARHRLAKKDPSAEVSDPVEPIVYYLDRGTPEPIASALMEGASWWNQAFEAAGYRNAFQVKRMPEGADNLDIRYNVIQWVHRSTRGWSYGGSISDPRTGEIIKGIVTLGSLRVRQDYMIAEGLLSPYENGTETPPELAAWALARLRQLAAHEVGHTLGFGHNYWASTQGRISVMDYPHPLVHLEGDHLDTSEVYDVGIGEWDKVGVAYAYQDFPPGADEEEELRAILDEAWNKDLIYMTNQDMSAQPRVHQWANGTDPAAELNRMMEIRRFAMDRFGVKAIKLGQPLALIEEVLVPLYLYQRYEVTAAASALGGLDYHYALRGDDHGSATDPVPADEQLAALDALLASIQPSQLALPRSILQVLPPRPSGYGFHRELFPRYTGLTFDAITPAVVATQHVASELFNPSRAARLVEQHALDPSLPGLGDVVDRTLQSVMMPGELEDAYQQEVARAVQRAIVDQLMTLAARADMPQVRAIATSRLARMAQHLGMMTSMHGGGDEAEGMEDMEAMHESMHQDMEAMHEGGGMQGASADEAHHMLLAMDIQRFLHRPAEAYSSPETPEPPPGAPIGQPAVQWLDGESTGSLPPVWSIADHLLGPWGCDWERR